MDRAEAVPITSRKIVSGECKEELARAKAVPGGIVQSPGKYGYEI